MGAAIFGRRAGKVLKRPGKRSEAF